MSRNRKNRPSQGGRFWSGVTGIRYGIIYKNISCTEQARGKNGFESGLSVSMLLGCCCFSPRGDTELRILSMLMLIGVCCGGERQTWFWKA